MNKQMQTRRFAILFGFDPHHYGGGVAAKFSLPGSYDERRTRLERVDGEYG